MASSITVPGNEAPLHYIVFSERSGRVGRQIARGGDRRGDPIPLPRRTPALRRTRTTATSSARADGARTAVYLPFGLAMSEDDARRIGRAVKNSGVPIKRWPG